MFESKRTVALFSSIAFLFLILASHTEQALNKVYHNYEDITTLLSQYSTNFPLKTHLYSIGKTVENRELWVLALSDTKPDVHIPLRPEAKYIANMHGNEVPSKEILLQLIDYMLNNQSTDSNIDFIMKNTRVHILVSLNPDGFERANIGDCDGLTGRNNARNYDINRNFPDYFETNYDPIQPETNAVIQWLDKNEFVISANFHGGSLVVNYPFDNYANSFQRPKENPSKDDDVFRFIAKKYSFNHPTMRTNPCTYESFTDGITNGGRDLFLC